ncbi:MAG: hypothetical protein RMN24_10490, partial [Anaerolineae bacterium]|nr:hypothetical protein [Anaerolineae bacterium]
MEKRNDRQVFGRRQPHCCRNDRPSGEGGQKYNGSSEFVKHMNDGDERFRLPPFVLRLEQGPMARRTTKVLSSAVVRLSSGISTDRRIGRRSEDKGRNRYRPPARNPASAAMIFSRPAAWACRTRS